MRILTALIFCLVTTFSGCLGVLFFLSNRTWVDFSVLEHYNPGKPSIVYDETGAEWTRFQLDKRDVISLKDIPPQVINAFLAAEDWHFFSHKGISIKGILRSIAVNIYKRRKAQGASTITQQLVRLLFFDAEKNFTRKIKEQFLSLIVELQFTKEQILEIYLNHIYFGCGIYGVEAASQRFWNKKTNQLTPDEAATLAGILRSPQKYCPLNNLALSEQRRNVILHQMHKLHFLTEAEYQQAVKKKLQVNKIEVSSYAPHLRESLRLFLEEKYGKQKLYSGGLKIQTTLNIGMQEKAEKAFKTHVKKFKDTILPDIDGALLTIEGSTGAIRCMIGGYNFQQSQYNRATTAQRQLGSTFKPIIYATALTCGMTLADTVIDEPLTLPDNKSEWTPRNFDHTHHGQITLAYALSHSNNIVSIKTLLRCGVHNIINAARDCGITGTLYPYPSLALGCVDGTVKEAATMFNVFAHQGLLVEPYFLVWIKDEWDVKIWKHTPTKKYVMPASITDQIARALSLSLERFKKKFPHALDCQAIGKTGTTNDARTCWYTGSTPQLTTCVYIGCDDNKSLGQEILASHTAFPIWWDFNKAVGSQEKIFKQDPSLQDITVNELTGQPVPVDHPDAMTILVKSSFC
jgi:penicillin-binding protein 1A